MLHLDDDISDGQEGFAMTDPHHGGARAGALDDRAQYPCLVLLVEMGGGFVE